MKQKLLKLMCLLCVGMMGMSAWGQTATWTRVTAVSELLEGGTFIIGYEKTASSGVLVPLRNDVANATTSSNGYFYSGTSSSKSGSGTINMSSISNTTAYEIIVTASSTVDGAINLQMADGKYFGNPSY